MTDWNSSERVLPFAACTGSAGCERRRFGLATVDRIMRRSRNLKAAMAFGTGHHGTTLGCLRALDRLATDGFVGRNVADIGCGTAVLAMGAARIWNDAIIASDIDEVAVEVAEANLRANDLTGKVTCVESAGFDNPEVSGRAPFDLVFANILKQPLIDLAPDMARYLGEGGYAILSGILTRQADEVVEVYARNGINLAHREEIGDWVTLMMACGCLDFPSYVIKHAVAAVVGDVCIAYDW